MDSFLCDRCQSNPTTRRGTGVARDTRWCGGVQKGRVISWWLSMNPFATPVVPSSLPKGWFQKFSQTYCGGTDRQTAIVPGGSGVTDSSKKSPGGRTNVLLLSGPRYSQRSTATVDMTTVFFFMYFIFLHKRRETVYLPDCSADDRLPLARLSRRIARANATGNACSGLLSDWNSLRFYFPDPGSFVSVTLSRSPSVTLSRTHSRTHINAARAHSVGSGRRSATTNRPGRPPPKGWSHCVRRRYREPAPPERAFIGVRWRHWRSDRGRH